jgi:hypothetical protein
MSLWILSHFRCWTSQTGRSHGELLFSWDSKNILYMLLRTIAFLLNFFKPTKQKFITWFFQVVSPNIIVKYGLSSLFRVQCLALVKAQVFDWKSMNVFINFILFELSWLFHSYFVSFINYASFIINVCLFIHIFLTSIICLKVELC